MSNDCSPFATLVSRIDPVLDFTADTAFVAVQIPLAADESVHDQVAVVTSNRELSRWDQASEFGERIITGRGCPVLLEPRWSGPSIREFLDGTPAPETAEIHQQIRQYLQKYLGLGHPAEYDLLALWIMGTYLKPLFKCYPILFFNAPYESGKSRCLETVSQLAFNGKWFGEISPAGFRRYGADIKPTFCLDELAEVGQKNDSPLIALLLNAYNSSEALFAIPGHSGGPRAELFKVASAVAIGNVQDIKNQALESRALLIRTEYDPRFKNTELPAAAEAEPSDIRDGLYRWFLGNWQAVRQRYRTYPLIPALSAREINSYKPLMAIAVLTAPEVAEAVTEYAIAAKKRKNMIKKATDDRFDLLLFLQSELNEKGHGEELPIISNKELADAFCRKNKLRLNYRRFLEMVSALGVTAEIKNRSGSKYLVLSRTEIEKQLRLCESKS
jgi:hypothetical protein